MGAKADLLRAALEVVEKRGLVYGQAENNFDRIADLWGVYLQQRADKAFTDISPTDVAAMMVLMKVARLMEKPDHYDSWLDIAGYAACGGEVSGSMAGETTKVPRYVAESMGYRAPTPEELQKRQMERAGMAPPSIKP